MSQLCSKNWWCHHEAQKRQLIDFPVHSKFQRNVKMRSTGIRKPDLKSLSCNDIYEPPKRPANELLRSKSETISPGSRPSRPRVSILSKTGSSLGLSGAPSAHRLCERLKILLNEIGENKPTEEIAKIEHKIDSKNIKGKSHDQSMSSSSSLITAAGRTTTTACSNETRRKITRYCQDLRRLCEKEGPWLNTFNQPGNSHS